MTHVRHQTPQSYRTWPNLYTHAVVHIRHQRPQSRHRAAERQQQTGGAQEGREREGESEGEGGLVAGVFRVLESRLLMNKGRADTVIATFKVSVNVTVTVTVSDPHCPRQILGLRSVHCAALCGVPMWSMCCGVVTLLKFGHSPVMWSL